MSKPTTHPKLRVAKPPSLILPGGQKRIAVSKPGDHLESEAEQIAQSALRAADTKFTSSDALIHQEQNEPQSPHEDADEQEEKKTSPKHRRTMKPGDNDGKPPKRRMSGRTSTDSMLSPGLSLDPQTRGEMEQRFGHDFSHVRIHSDDKAAHSAQSLGAFAYTLGNSIVFGAGQYAPQYSWGWELLAHELAHVVQSDAGMIMTPTILRRSFWENVEIFFGTAEGVFTDEELLDYLKLVTDGNDIENDYDSDNKARAIVRLWMAGNVKFELTVRQKILLIKEMQSGPTLNEDEQQILNLLENSDNADLRIIFSPGEINVKDLNSDFQGDEWDTLKNFYERRFEGGMEALLKGEVKPKGSPLKGAPEFPAYNWSMLQSRLQENYTLDEVLDYVAKLTPDEKLRATKDMQVERIKNNETLNDLIAAKKDKEKIRALWKYIVKIDTVLAKQYVEVAEEAKGKKKKEILAETTKLTPDQKKAAKEALSPPVKTDSSGKKKKFVDPKGYEKKLREHLDNRIKTLYEDLVVNKGEKEHGDAKLTYPLKKFEELANVAQAETDEVFAPYIGKKPGKSKPVFKADLPKGGPGNIHDLWADLDKEFKKDEKKKGPFRLDMAQALIMYFLQSDKEVLSIINRNHFASPEFDKNDKPVNDEAKIQTKLSVEYTDTDAKVKKLNEIDRGWEATANFEKREINVQIFRPVDEKTKKVNEEKDRFFLWDWFQTMIHEYCHTLVHKDYRDFAVSFGTNSVAYNTLMEGVDSWLDEVAWAKIEPKSKSKALREKVEGLEYAKKEPLKEYPSITRQRYPTFDQAVQLVNAVGPKNLYAAYFLGKAELIGK